MSLVSLTLLALMEIWISGNLAEASSRIGPATEVNNTASVPSEIPLQCRRRPKAPEPVPEVVEGSGPSVTYVNQSDAYATAAEQATFLAVYQIHMGPYGVNQDPAEREKLIRETSQAIDDCINNSSSCNEEKQKKVLKALVQLNQGLDIRCMMLVNSHNRERMRSVPQEDGTNVLPAYYQGTEFEYRKKANSWKFEKIQKPTEMQRTAGILDGQYFQLDETAARRTALAPELEIMGANFVREYGIFVDNYTSTQREDGSRYYKFIPAGEASYEIITDRNGNRVIDQEKFETAIREQSNPTIQKIARDYQDSLAKARPTITPPSKPGADGPEGRIKIDPGFNFSDVGIGFRPDTNPPVVENLSYEDLKKDGRLDDEGRARATVRFLNHKFRVSAEERIARDIASSADPAAAAKAPRGYVNVTLDPARFDQFLDEIWPSAATREQIRAGTYVRPAPVNRQ